MDVAVWDEWVVSCVDCVLCKSAAEGFESLLRGLFASCADSEHRVGL